MKEVLLIDIPSHYLNTDQRYIRVLRQRIASEYELSNRRINIQNIPRGSKDFSRGLLTIASALEFAGIEHDYFNIENFKASL